MNRRTIPVLSCGIYQAELEKVLPELEAELGADLRIRYLPPALDVNETRLAGAIAGELAERRAGEGGEAQPLLLLYGRMCHTDMAGIARGTGALYPGAANCVEMFLGPETKKDLDATGNVYYLTMAGSFNSFRLLFPAMVIPPAT